MKKYEKLLDYISYFEDDTNVFCTWKSSQEKSGNVIEMAYPAYDEKLERFIEDVYKTDLLHKDYLDHLEKYMSKLNRMIDGIDGADMDLLRAILTYFIRQERFCDGLWEEAVENKIFLKILYRLKHLIYAE